MENLPKFTVCMSVYSKSKPDEFLAAFNSIIQQTAPPQEIILIIDGPISNDLEQTIEKTKALYDNLLQIIRLNENCGLGIALKTAIENASNELIARMDSDDISYPDRFAAQLDYFTKHPDVAILGGQITEFIDNPNNIIGKRVVPLDHEAIAKYMKKRCAMNHPTVMFRKEAVINAGNYQDWFLNEDYYLWIRMLKCDYKFANLNKLLVNIRVSKELYIRRGGKAYFKSEVEIQKLMRKLRMISLPRELYNIIIRFCVQILLPNSLRALLYQSVFRTKADA